MSTHACTTDGTFCEAMTRMLAKRPCPGLHPVEFIHKPTRTFRTAVKYKRTKSHKGILLNTCPWCGADFTSAYKDPNQ